MDLAILWIALSAAAGMIASSKGRSGLDFFFLSVLLSPIVGITAAIMARSSDAIERDNAEFRGDRSKYRKCPYCAELVRTEAIKCRFCGSEIGSDENPVHPPEPQRPTPTTQPGLTHILTRDVGAVIRSRRGNNSKATDKRST